MRLSLLVVQLTRLRHAVLLLTKRELVAGKGGRCVIVDGGSWGE